MRLLSLLQGTTRGLLAGVVGCLLMVSSGKTQDSLPEFESLNDVYQMVSQNASCPGSDSEPPTKILPGGVPPGESKMCANGVEVIWFESLESKEWVQNLLGDAAGSGGSVRFVEGANWLVADYSEVQVGATPNAQINMKQLAERLDAEYVELSR